MFCWECLSVSLSFEGDFCQYRTPGGCFFSVNNLTLSSHCFLASMTSSEQSAVNLIEESLLLAAFKILSSSLTFSTV